MSNASERHNRLAREFVMKAGHETATYSELMVVIESTIFATMLLMQKLHGLTAEVSAEMVESAVHRATERFVGGQP